MDISLDPMRLRRTEGSADELDGIDIWTTLDMEDVIQDVMVDVRMSNVAECFSSSTATKRATRDAMMSQGLERRTMGAAIQKHVVYCHQPPWKPGCTYGIGENRGRADKHGRRYCYECTLCGSKWNQTRPELLSAGEDPLVRASNRCTNVSDMRRSNGYKCRV